MSKSASAIQSQIATCEGSTSEAIEICEKLAEERQYSFNLNLQSFKEELPRMDLEDFKVKVDKQREILNEVTRVLELERERRTYVNGLRDKILKTKRKQSVKVENLERSFRRSDTFRVRIPNAAQERQPNPSSLLPNPTSPLDLVSPCPIGISLPNPTSREEITERKEGMNLDETKTPYRSQNKWRE